MAKKMTTAPVSAAAAEPYSWQDMREIRLPRDGSGENKSLYVCINGREFSVPAGKTVTVPYPVYERLKIREHGLELVQDILDQDDNKLA